MTLKRVLCIMVTCLTTLTLVRLNPCRWSCTCNYYINKNLCSRFVFGSCGYEYLALMALGQWTAMTLSCKFLWLWTLEHKPKLLLLLLFFFLNHLAKQDFSLRTITFCFQNMKLLSKTGNQTASYKKIFIFLDGVPKCMIGKQFKYTNTI